MSRSRRPRCTSSRVRCGRCTDTRQFRRRARELVSARDLSLDLDDLIEHGYVRPDDEPHENCQFCGTDPDYPRSSDGWMEFLRSLAVYPPSVLSRPVMFSPV